MKNNMLEDNEKIKNLEMDDETNLSDCYEQKREDDMNVAPNPSTNSDENRKPSQKFGCFKKITHWYDSSLEDGLDDESSKGFRIEVCKRQADETPETESVRQLDRRITDILWTMGISANLQGHYFFKEAIRLAVSDPKYIESVTRVLYPQVARKYQTTACRVERSMRHALEVSFKKGRLLLLNNLLNLTIFDVFNKPTNSEFIALVADKLALDFN